MIKQVRDSKRNLIYEKTESGDADTYEFYREYSTGVDELGWVITLKIPEKALLHDIINLRNTSLVFAMIIGSIAFIAALVFCPEDTYACQTDHRGD